MSFAGILSPFVVCLPILLTLSFTEQKFLILMKSSLSIISFTSHTFGVISKKPPAYRMLSRFSLMLHSRRFIVLHFTFSYVIQFELIFVKGVKSVSRFFFFFFFLHMDVQLFQHHLFKGLSLLHYTAFAPL